MLPNFEFWSNQSGSCLWWFRLSKESWVLYFLATSWTALRTKIKLKIQRSVIKSHKSPKNNQKIFIFINQLSAHWCWRNIMDRTRGRTRISALYSGSLSFLNKLYHLRPISASKPKIFWHNVHVDKQTTWKIRTPFLKAVWILWKLSYKIQSSNSEYSSLWNLFANSHSNFLLIVGHQCQCE